MFVVPLNFIWLGSVKYTITEQLIDIYIYCNNTQQHPFWRCSGCVRAFWLRYDFKYRMQYSCIGQFSASNTAMRHFWTSKMQTRNIPSTTTSQAMLHVHACMYKTCTHVHTPSLDPKEFHIWRLINIHFFCEPFTH